MWKRRADEQLALGGMHDKFIDGPFATVRKV